MKFRTYVLALLLLPAVAAAAEEREAFRIQQEAKVQKYSIAEPWRHIFRDNIVDLKISVRADEVQRGDLISHPSSDRQQEYKPLNPIVVSW
jgi:hypothetical protein